MSYRVLATAVAITMATTLSAAFVPPSPADASCLHHRSSSIFFLSSAKERSRIQSSPIVRMIDPGSAVDTFTTAILHPFTTSNIILSFSDQGQNLAGILFQASLLPYLVFLYFLSFRANRVPALGNFGFQFLLLFVLATIPGGIIAKTVYGSSLANVDWLHGGAESLLTITNILIVLGFRGAMTTDIPEVAKEEQELPFLRSLKEKTQPYVQSLTEKPRITALGCAALYAAACAVGPTLGFDVHSPFLFGLGNLPNRVTESLPWVTHSEPTNALSLATWAIHFSSVFEWLFAMNIIWDFSKTTGNEKWKGMTWGMLPLHASGIAACADHFFYNPSSLQFLVSTQAFLTLFGNLTVAIAAYRIALSNGWTLGELNPFPQSKTSTQGILVDNLAATPLVAVEKRESDGEIVAKLAAITFGSAYLVKYGELGLDFPFSPNAFAAIAILVSIPALTAFRYYDKSKVEAGGEPVFSFPSLSGSKDGGGRGGLSMADIKKYGVSGTVAYVLTELAFWAVAFPVASNALYQSTGHWPDVINDGTDRATVLGFIFAGANIARLLVPIRLGAALALAPWVDENILSRFEGKEENDKQQT